MESRIQIPEMKTETETETESRIKQLHQKKNKKAKFTSIIWSIKIKSPVQKEFVFLIVYRSIKSSHDGVQAHAKSIRILREVIDYIFAH